MVCNAISRNPKAMSLGMLLGVFLVMTSVFVNSGERGEKMKQATDEQQIRAVVTDYFEGSYYGDKARLIRAFHPDAHIVGNFNGTVADWTRAKFIERAITKPTQSDRNEAYVKKIITIDAQKDAAMVKAIAQVGGQQFTDYITLLKIDGHWVIRNKSFTNAPSK